MSFFTETKCHIFIKTLQRSSLKAEGNRYTVYDQSTNDAAAASVDVAVPHGQSRMPKQPTSASDRRAHCKNHFINFRLSSAVCLIKAVKTQVVISLSQHLLFQCCDRNSPASLQPSCCKRTLINNQDLFCFVITNPADLIIRHFFVLIRFRSFV